MPRVRQPIATNPVDFPVEISMLFEKAAYGPVRVPEAGKSFETELKAQGIRLAFSKYRAQMKRSKDCPPLWSRLLVGLQFHNPVKEDDGWCFYIKPMLDGNQTVTVAKGVVGEPVPLDKFWETYKQ